MIKLLPLLEQQVEMVTYDDKLAKVINYVLNPTNFAKYFSGNVEKAVQYIEKLGVVREVVNHTKENIRYGDFRYLNAAERAILVFLVKNRRGLLTRQETWEYFVGNDRTNSFGSMDEYVTFLKKNRLFNRAIKCAIDSCEDIHYELQNKLILYLAETRPKFTRKLIYETFDDLQEMNGKLYLVLDNREDLADMFKDDETARAVLGDGLDMDWWWPDTAFDDYLIDNLNERATQKVLDVILEKHANKRIYPDDNFDNESYRDDEEEEGFVITKKKLQEIEKNGDLYELLDNCDDLEDIKNAITHCYDDAYRIAMESEYYNTVMKEVEYVFGNKGEEFATGRKLSLKNHPGETYTEFKYKIELSDKTLFGILKDYLDSENWGEHSSFFGIVCGRDKINVNWPDYADASEFYDDEIIEMLSDRAS